MPGGSPTLAEPSPPSLGPTHPSPGQLRSDIPKPLGRTKAHPPTSTEPSPNLPEPTPSFVKPDPSLVKPMPSLVERAPHWSNAEKRRAEPDFVNTGPTCLTCPLKIVAPPGPWSKPAQIRPNSVRMLLRSGGVPERFLRNEEPRFFARSISTVFAECLPTDHSKRWTPSTAHRRDVYVGLGSASAVVASAVPWARRGADPVLEVSSQRTRVGSKVSPQTSTRRTRGSMSS